MRATGLSFVLALFAFSFLSLPQLAGQSRPGGGLNLRTNLDLPYNAGGTTEEEEVAPEVIFFFGQMYEMDAVCFSLDKSGSMTSNNRWTLQTREVTRTLLQMAERAEFGIVYYGSRVEPFRNKPVEASPASKSAGVAFVRGQSAQGDTCLFEGTIEALKIVRRSKSKRRAVIVTSDGRPDVCSTGDRATASEVERLLAQTLAANPGRQVKVHTIWVGSGTDREAVSFMRRLAQVHGGNFRQVSR